MLLKKDTEEKNYLNPEIAEKNNDQAKEYFTKGEYPKAL